jgi:hypothetical protein
MSKQKELIEEFLNNHFEDFKPEVIYKLDNLNSDKQYQRFIVLITNTQNKKEFKIYLATDGDEEIYLSEDNKFESTIEVAYDDTEFWKWIFSLLFFN